MALIAAATIVACVLSFSTLTVEVVAVPDAMMAVNPDVATSALPEVDLPNNPVAFAATPATPTTTQPVPVDAADEPLDAEPYREMATPYGVSPGYLAALAACDSTGELRITEGTAAELNRIYGKSWDGSTAEGAAQLAVLYTRRTFDQTSLTDPASLAHAFFDGWGAASRGEAPSAGAQAHMDCVLAKLGEVAQ